MQDEKGNLNGSKVLVTGAAGFVGSHLCDRFLKLGAQVTGVDNLLTGKLSNIVHLLDSSHPQSQLFSFINADVTKDPETYLPADYVPDIVLHFASPASPPKYQAHPVETYQVNAFATHELLKFLKKTNPKAVFVFASTSECYGDPAVHPQVESYWGNVNPNGLRSCYDESKRLGETICGVFFRTFGIDTRIVRIFNTYGPRLDLEDGRVIPSFISSVLSSKPLRVYGDGSQTRSYCYVDDLVEGVARMTTTPGLGGETVNLGNPEEFTILETVECLKSLLPKQNLEVTHHPLPQDDPRRRCPDIAKARNLLSWEPKVSFKDGLKRTLDYYLAH